MKIFFGAPIFVTLVGVMLFGETLLKKFGPTTGAYLGLGFFLFNIGISLYLYDRISKAVIIPAGIIGWLLTLLLAAWYYFWGPGAFAHSHF